MRADHLLIIRLSAMGDVAMTVPVVYSLAKQYPHIRISILSRPFAHVFFENLAPNVTFIAADIKNEYRHISGLNKLYRRLAAKQFTAVADFHDILRTKYLRMRFCIGQYRVTHINKHRSEKRRLTAQHHKMLQPIQSSFLNYADVLAQLGYPIQLDFTSIFRKEGGNLEHLPGNIVSLKEHWQWIGIAPFAAHRGKIYPLESMEKVIRKIQEKYPNSKIFLFGGNPQELQALDTWAEKYPNCINASSALSGLEQELILMSHLRVMISMDSANMHLASLVNTPVVSIWGATHPFAGFMGWNQRIDNAVQVALPCRPCSIYGNKPCLRKDYACLNNITTEQIIQKIETLLTQ